MTNATETMLDQLRVIRLETDRLSVSILPEVGGKILTLFDKESAKNVLWENPRIRPQRYPIDANFDNYWCGGWDDAFPTADACIHQGEQFPNLGELRSLNWTVDELATNGTDPFARLTAYGPISAVKATKTITLHGSELRMSFKLQNEGPLPIDFLWGTHPSFAVKAGTRLILPARTGIVVHASHPSLGSPGQRYTWPTLNGTDMSLVPDITAGVACGHYATDLEDGWFAIETDGRGILFEFPLAQCPHLWLWLVYGGWRGYHHAIVEPWTGYPVNLAEASALGRSNLLEPGGAFAVTVSCRTYKFPDTYKDALAHLRNG